jgi:predicted dehydrogenase
LSGEEFVQDLTRRQFLRSASPAAAGLGLVAAPAIAQNRLSPNERVRVAVVGFRGRGRVHIRCLHLLAEQNVELAALCDIDESVLNRRASDYEKLSGKKVKKFTDVRKLLEDKSIDAVSYATPNHWHALGVVWACQAGKDVYVEKPASHNFIEGRKAVEAARKYNRIVQHGTQCRTSANIREGIQKLREGVIGEVYMARGIAYKWRNSIGSHKEESVPPGVHYDLWIGPAPVRPFSRLRFHSRFHWLWDYGNGEIGNQGVHQLDIMRWGLGLDTHPTRVQSMGGVYVHEDEQETPNVQVASFQYEGRKLLLQFEVRHWMSNHEAGIGDVFPFMDKRSSVGVMFYGSEGYMLIPDYTSYHTFLGRSRTPGPKAEGGPDPMADLDHFINFIRAVRSRNVSDLTADIEEGHMSSALCHLANIAYRGGRSLAFDPSAERFVGDEEGNRSLTRDYRPPFVVPESV